jgi:hypothetical protein
MKKIILLASLLLASCTTQAQTVGNSNNDFEKFLSNLDIDYVIYDEKCSSGFNGKDIRSIMGSKIQVRCLMYYEIIPIESGWNINIPRNYYLVIIDATKDYYFLQNDYVIDKNGILVKHDDFFGGK